MKGTIFSINISKKKGIAKEQIKEAKLIENLGMEGDVHAAPGDRQVSLLAFESIEKQQSCSKVQKEDFTLKAGDFAENITTKGIVLSDLKIGDKLKIGAKVELEISKIGKECHRYCSIYYKTGDCIMPREGIFGAVIKGGDIKVGDSVDVIGSQ